MSTALDIADAIVGELNDNTFSPTFTAVRRNRPQFELSDMGTLHVTVVPGGWERDYGSRTEDQCTYRTAVGVQQKFAVKDGAGADIDNPADTLIELVEAIAAYLLGRSLADLPAAKVLSVALTEQLSFNLAHWEQWHQFTSFVVVTTEVVQ